MCVIVREGVILRDEPDEMMIWKKKRHDIPDTLAATRDLFGIPSVDESDLFLRFPELAVYESLFPSISDLALSGSGPPCQIG
jgi:hypothetical protein